MEAKQLRRRQVKNFIVITLVLTIILVGLIKLILIGYGVDWTGFNGDNKTGKTLYDWLQLLIVPLALAGIGLWFNHRERKVSELRSENEQKAVELRAEHERKASELRATEERIIEQLRANHEQAIALDNQRQTALQAYINEMSDLLLREKLHESEPDSEVRYIARANVNNAFSIRR